MAGSSQISAVDVLIVGGGIVGSACAALTSRAGASVTLIETNSELGLGASAAKSGLLTTAADGRSGSAYARFSALALERLRAIIPILETETGASAQVIRSRHLRIAAGTDEETLLDSYLGASDLRQPDEMMVDGEALRANRPWLSRKVTRGIIGGHAHHLQPSSFLKILACACRQAGVTIETGVKVASLKRRNSRIVGVRLADGRVVRAGTTVLAAGFESAALLTSIGQAIRLLPVRGQMAIVQGLEEIDILEDVISTGRGYIVPKPGGLIVIGATHERDNNKPILTLGGMGTLARIASVVPALTRLPIVGTFTGIRPMSPDGLPLIGPVPDTQGLLVATGHGSHGVLLSVATGEAIRDMAAGYSVTTDLATFDPRRWVGREHHAAIQVEGAL
ncbi:hypothetical protein B5P46_01645 [Rhizobium leguminosarum]|uniref:FAD dependent oxidoreductase domain-containing protein n=1 Tax=Rhizobium leguminosarum TaxID=384 RepID=A0A4Q1UDR1_RHILE|nr:FAD-dependent oxidoreductase [Rhizobium leguminosarum]RXT29803.1 hypothetical protein B5P46_01645 [Rhizobium leguminosarum]